MSWLWIGDVRTSVITIPNIGVTERGVGYNLPRSEVAEEVHPMTRKCAAVFTMVGLACALTQTEAVGQTGRNQPASLGWGATSQYNRLYDPDAVKMLSGEVLGIEQFTPVGGAFPGLHLLMQDEGETVSIHLGPVWFIEDQEIQIQIGDHVRVLGSSVLFDGKRAIIAAEVVEGSDTLSLRYPNGVPVWSRGGGGRRRPG